MLLLSFKSTSIFPCVGVSPSWSTFSYHLLLPKTSKTMLPKKQCRGMISWNSTNIVLLNQRNCKSHIFRKKITGFDTAWSPEKMFHARRAPLFALGSTFQPLACALRRVRQGDGWAFRRRWWWAMGWNGWNVVNNMVNMDDINNVKENIIWTYEHGMTCDDSNAEMWWKYNGRNA